MGDEIEYASIPRRLAAAAIDLAVLAGVTGLVALQQAAPDTEGVVLGLFVFASAVTMFYRMVTEGSAMKATPGKYLLGLKAVQRDGGQMMFVGSALRSWPWWLTGAVGALAPALIPAVGVLCLLALAPILWDQQRRGLHDRMAGTLVIMRHSEPPPEHLDA